MATAAPAGVVEREPALPQTTIDTGHADMIHDSQLDYYGLRLATASSDRTVRIFSPTGGSPPQHTLSAELVGHDGPVWQVSWAHPSFGGLLASAGFDGRVILWKEDVGTGAWRRAYEYSWHASSVNSVAFAPAAYGLAFACASSDGFVSIVTHNPADGTWADVRVSDAADGGAQTHALGASSVSFAPATFGGLGEPDGALPPLRIVTGGCDALVKVWTRGADGGWTRDGPPLAAHREWVRSVAWAPALGAGRDVVASGGQDKRVVVWTRGDSGGPWEKKELPDFGAPVWSVSWTPAGGVLGVASGDSSVTMWKEGEGGWALLSRLDEPEPTK